MFFYSYHHFVCFEHDGGRFSKFADDLGSCFITVARGIQFYVQRYKLLLLAATTRGRTISIGGSDTSLDPLTRKMLFHATWKKVDDFLKLARFPLIRWTVDSAK